LLSMENRDAQGVARRIAGEIVMSPRPCDAIRKWRKVFEVSQIDLAKRMGVSPSVVSDYESGRRRSPRIDTIQRILRSLIEIDLSRGGRTIKTLKRMLPPENLTGVILDMKEFPRPITAQELVDRIKGEVAVGEELLDRQIFGYTVIDSPRAIVELRSDDFMRFYGMSSERALVFTGVSTGRSPFVAIKVGGINPGIVVLHGEDLRRVDPLGIRIAEREGIPLIISRIQTVRELIDGLRGVM